MKIRTLLEPRLKELGMTQADLSDTASLTQTGVLDSFALMEVLAQVEGDLGVQLDFGALEMDAFTTIRGLGTSFAKALAP